MYLEGAATRQSMLSRDHHGPRAVLNALERLARDYDAKCSRSRQDLTIAEGQLRDYQARLGGPFAHESYLSRLTALRDELKAALSGRDTEGVSSASELADEIKVLRSAHTIEAAPQRRGNCPGSAEEPVTARIRRRLEAVLGSDSSVQAPSETAARPLHPAFLA